MADGGPRFSGSPSHDRYVDFLEQAFADSGLTVHRDRQRFTRWTAQHWALEAGGRHIPVASYYSYSGQTQASGVTGELVYAGAVPPPSLPGSPFDVPATADAVRSLAAEVNAGIAERLAAVPGGVAGKVVLMDAAVPPLAFGALYPDMTYLYDPAGTTGPGADFKRAALLLATVPPLNAFQAAGAKGVVFAVDASAANAAGQYAPFIEPYQNLPALLVDRRTGGALREAAARHERARLTLVARLDPNTPTDTLWAVLPGQTSELMIVNSHTDGPNVAEENGGLALVALARELAQTPRRRGIAFVAVTGHFAAELKSTNGWVADHQDLVKRAAAGLCLEHLGCREWIDDPVRGYHASGLYEPTRMFHSQTPIAAYGAQTVTAAGLDRTAFLRPAGMTFLGEGAALHESGIPTLGFIPAPNYLLSFADHQHLDKVDPAYMRRQIRWAAELIRTLDGVPAAALKAGDSAALPSQLGGWLTVK